MKPSDAETSPRSEASGETAGSEALPLTDEQLKAAMLERLRLLRELAGGEYCTLEIRAVCHPDSPAEVHFAGYVAGPIGHVMAEPSVERVLEEMRARFTLDSLRELRDGLREISARQAARLSEVEALLASRAATAGEGGGAA